MKLSSARRCLTGCRKKLKGAGKGRIATAGYPSFPEKSNAERAAGGTDPKCGTPMTSTVGQSIAAMINSRITARRCI